MEPWVGEGREEKQHARLEVIFFLAPSVFSCEKKTKTKSNMKRQEEEKNLNFCTCVSIHMADGGERGGGGGRKKNRGGERI